MSRTHLSIDGRWGGAGGPVAAAPEGKRGRRRRAGFTLIESALATIIVGVGVLAIVAAQQAFHHQNGWSTHASTATCLGNEIRELTFNMPRHDPVTGNLIWGFEAGETLETFDDLDDFDGLTFSADVDPPTGPINALRQIIPNMAGWSQTIHVESIDPFDITDETIANGATTMMKVTVVVEYQGPNDDEPYEVTRVSWISPN